MPSENADYAQKAEFANTIDETVAPFSACCAKQGWSASVLPRGRRGDRETIASFLARRLCDGCCFIFGRILMRGNAPRV